MKWTGSKTLAVILIQLFCFCNVDWLNQLKNIKKIFFLLCRKCILLRRQHFPVLWHYNPTKRTRKSKNLRLQQSDSCKPGSWGLEKDVNINNFQMTFLGDPAIPEPVITETRQLLIHSLHSHCHNEVTQIKIFFFALIWHWSHIFLGQANPTFLNPMWITWMWSYILYVLSFFCLYVCVL